MNCNSNNIIYLIPCNKCHKQYVGQTGRKLKDRLNNHRSSIKLNNNNPISKHFNDIGLTHNYYNLNIIPIDIEKDYERRIIKEKAWIQELCHLLPTQN